MPRVVTITAMVAASWFILVYLMVSGIADSVGLDE